LAGTLSRGFAKWANSTREKELSLNFHSGCPLQPGVRFQALAERSNQDRHRLSAFRHRGDVFLANAVEVMVAQQTPVRRNADEGPTS
jgi:hypothetical protein